MPKFVVCILGILLFITPAYANQVWYVQAAACLKEKCINTYRHYIEALGLDSQVQHNQSIKNTFDIISHPTRDRSQAIAFVKKINADQRVRVKAKLEEIADLVYVDLGHQSNEKQAAWLVNFANFIGQDYQLEFSFKLKVERKFSVKILSGPFLTQESAYEALLKIREIKDFSTAFVVSKEAE